jgi:TolB-like protein
VPFFSSCHYREGVSTELQQGEKIVLNRIAVLPFQRMGPEDASVKAVRCPLCGSILGAGILPPDAQNVIEDIFISRLSERKKFQIIPPDRAGAFFSRISETSLTLPLLEIIKKVGAELDADGVVVGYVYRYRERKGYPYAAERPASVTFEIHLVRTSDGMIVWKGTFDRTQQPLMENMFQIASFFKGQGQWLTAKELAAEGMDALLEKFPGFE